MKPSLSQEWRQDLKKNYHPEELDFPRTGNQKEELLAYQIDQRVTSFMYSPGMERLLDRLDKNIMAGIRLIEEETDEKIMALNDQHQSDTGELTRQLRKTRTALWGLGGVVALAGLAFDLWPNIKTFIARKAKVSNVEVPVESAVEEAEEEEEVEVEIQENEVVEGKNYFKWKRDKQDVINWK